MDKKTFLERSICTPGNISCGTSHSIGVEDECLVFIVVGELGKVDISSKSLVMDYYYFLVQRLYWCDIGWKLIDYPDQYINGRDHCKTCISERTKNLKDYKKLDTLHRRKEVFSKSIYFNC